MRSVSRRAFSQAVVVSLGVPSAVLAQKKYDAGASDKEIKVGNTMPYSGPASAYGTIGKAEAAYFKMINDKGGVNGRKINFISVDDGYAPPKTVEMVRRLVEQDEVLFIFNTLGTPSNTAIQKYMQAKKVPQLFVATGASKWNDPKGNPWTMGWQPNYHTEGVIYARHALAARPNAKIGILVQNDDFGKDYLGGIKEGLGDKVKQIVMEATYEITDPTVDSQVVSLKGAGVDVLFNITTPKFAAMSIRKIHDIGWQPAHYLTNVSASVGSVLVPAGLEKAVGIITSQYVMDPTDPRFQEHPHLLEWKEFLKKYYPDADLKDSGNVYGYVVAQGLVKVLEQCGDNLTRENVMKQAASLKDFAPKMMLPGIKVNTSATDFAPIESVQLVKFDGKQFAPLGEVVGK